jgi:hypothetical protein
VRGCNPKRPLGPVLGAHEQGLLLASLQSLGPSFFSIMTKLNSLAWARVIGPEGGAEDGAVGARVGEGDAGVDVLVVSSSPYLTDIWRTC